MGVSYASMDEKRLSTDIRYAYTSSEKTKGLIMSEKTVENHLPIRISTSRIGM